MKIRTSAALLVILGLAACGKKEEGSTSGGEKSLYDRLGGTYAIAVVCDDLLNRVAKNETLNANPAIKEARDRVPGPGLKVQLTAMVINATGGPYGYHGRSMKDAHAHLNITEKEWKALADDFKASLDHFKVPEKEQKELFAIVESTKKDIVVDKPTGAKVDPKAIYPKESDTSLYGRLGGVYNIASVVDAVVTRVGENEVLNANPAIKKARGNVPGPALKFQLTAYFCEAAGGPLKYNGRTMKEAHAHLEISQKEWDALGKDFKATLDEFKVPEKEQKELLDIVDGLKKDIITK